MEVNSGDEEGLRARKGMEISSLEGGKLDENRRSDKKKPGSLLRRGIKFFSVVEFLNFLEEGEVNDESSLPDPGAGSFEVENNDEKSGVAEREMVKVDEVAAIEEGVAGNGSSKKKDKSGWPQCGLCGKKYSSKQNIKKHISTVHLEEVTHKDFKKHIIPGQEEKTDKFGWIATKPTMHCGLCGKKYSSKQNIKKHIFNVHTEEVDCEDIKKYILPGEHKNSKKGNEMEDPRVENWTCEREVAEEEDSKRTDDDVKRSKGGSLSCEHCYKVFNNYTSFNQHRHMGVYLVCFFFILPHAKLKIQETF